MVRALEIDQIIGRDKLATEIARTFQEWEMMRNVWLAQKQELRDYLFATDTNSTTAGRLPWKNSVHIPKLCQIRDNLHANYMAALFPNDNAIQWDGDDEDSQAKAKRNIIQSYMSNKMTFGGFQNEMSKILYDWIDYGNCFANTQFVAEKTHDGLTNEEIPGYVGPKLVRISPLDIVFNPTAASWSESPKIIRSIKTIGSLKADMDDHPEMQYLQEAFERLTEGRKKFAGFSQGDQAKIRGFQVDGFGSLHQYFQSNYVEILDFYGDFYDVETNQFYKNQLISVVDRCHVIRNVPNPSWLGSSNIFHCGWRLRPDNLYAMGPLDNLVGMQYRIDHLENAKSDAFDLIVHPVMKVTGFVEDFEYGPGERIFCGEEGDVAFMHPDWGVLGADNQIAQYEQQMEEMAGAPKQAMGFRTPGEKTAYEVQVLENGSNRVFLNKSTYLEKEFMEPALNSMLELSRRNMGVSDVIRVVDDQYGAVEFLTVTREDIAARGKIRPVGAHHFQQNANLIQNLTQFSNSPLGQDPSVNVHISGLGIANLVEHALGLERYKLVKSNIRLMENAESQQLKNSAMQVTQQQDGAGLPPNASGMVQPSQDQAGAGQIQGNSPQ